MKLSKKKEIQYYAWKHAWDKYKAEYTMKQIAEALQTNLPTFWRVVSNYGKKQSK